VYVLKADFPADDPKRIPLPATLPELLQLATQALELRRPAVHVSDTSQTTITVIAAIAPGAHLLISSVAPVGDKIEPVYKSRLPPEKCVPLKLVPQPKRKAKAANANEHQLIAASRLTVNETIRDSLLTLYSVLTPEHRAQLPSSPALQELGEKVQQFAVQDSLLSQFIGPFSSVVGTRLGEETQDFALKTLQGVRADHCRFAIFGPEQSGKSTLLFLLVTLFFRKLQLAGEAFSYLIVPFNWQFHQMYLGCPEKLYELVVIATLTALRAVRFDVIPCLPLLQEWFLSLLSIPTLPPLLLPPSKRPEPTWLRAVKDIGRTLHRYWTGRDSSWTEAPVVRLKGREDDSLRKFVTATITFPLRLANAFDFRSAVLVFDHLDLADFVLHPGDRFAGGPVDVFPIVWEAMSEVPFFAASRSDGALFRLFKESDGTDFTHISTEHIIQNLDGKEVVAPEAELSVSPAMCRGCPGYCALLQTICELAEQARERLAIRSQAAPLKAVVDIARNDRLKEEFLRLARLLLAFDSDEHIQEEKLATATKLPEFTVKLVGSTRGAPATSKGG
jgi:hypothetical protein